MLANGFQIGTAFLEGIFLIISPCILPILPIILAGSALGSKKRPYGIIVGFIIVFSLFTFFSRKIIQITHFDINIIRYFSYVVLITLGIIMLSTFLTEQFNRLTNRLMMVGSQSTLVNNPEGGFMSGLLFGGLTAIIWTPCAGPILAAIIVQTVIQETDLMSFIMLISFSIGVGIPMLLITLFGRRILNNFNYIKTHASLFRKVLGAIIILSVFYMIYLENGLQSVYANQNNTDSGSELKDTLRNPYPAPSISGIAAWINTNPLQLANLKGKVILIDFWTYSCINCIRTLPYLKSWYAHYRDKGFVIIGIHSPEFPFEKEFNNVKNAVTRLGIEYPVGLDNQFITWRNFNNSYWPAHYLIDKNGNVVYTHFGEGNYDITENNIRYLLGIHANMAAQTLPETESFSSLQTPETYLGYARANSFANPDLIIPNKSTTYTYPNRLLLHQWALKGTWKIDREKIIAMQANAAIKIHFYAKKLFMVMGSNAQQPIKIKVILNGKLINSGKGIDVTDDIVKVDHHALYEIISLEKPEENILEMITLSPGLEIYTFTFGS